VEHGTIVLRKPAKTVRAGWAQAAAALSAKGEDALLMGEFGNSEDEELGWLSAATFGW
jgi:antitoxin MazE